MRAEVAEGNRLSFEATWMARLWRLGVFGVCTPCTYMSMVASASHLIMLVLYGLLLPVLNRYDNRSRKTSDRQPDFVRRDDRRAALWLDSEWLHLSRGGKETRTRI